MGLKRRIVIIIILVILGGAGLGGVLFMVRAPVVMVAADEFTGLYGARRTRVKQAAISLKLFRQVKVVRIADGASADVVAFAAAAAAQAPYAALFPAMYQQGAQRYAEQAPDVPVGILGGGSGDRGGSGNLVFFEADRKTDLYRVGLCTAIFARSGGGILFFTGNADTGDTRQAFLTGLQDQGIETAPLFVSSGENYTPPEGISCVIIAAPAQVYLDNNPVIPTILFSALDPGITPREIKLIVDDSPWALAEAAVKLLHRAEAEEGEERLPGPLLAPSEILAPGGRIKDAVIRREIKKALRKFDNTPIM
jgi:hypothetical protein